MANSLRSGFEACNGVFDLHELACFSHEGQVKLIVLWEGVDDRRKAKRDIVLRSKMVWDIRALEVSMLVWKVCCFDTA
jgi:hypothetical protein